MFVGIDVHKHTHAAALVDQRGGELGVLLFANSPAGYRRLTGWLADRGAVRAVIGVESPGSYGRCLVGALAAAGPRGPPRSGLAHASRTPPAGARQDRSRRRIGDRRCRSPQAHRPRARRSSPNSSARSACSNCSDAASSATAPRRSSGCGPTGRNSTPSARLASCDCNRQRELRRLKRIALRRRSHRADRGPLHPRTRPRHRGPQPAHRRARQRDRRRCWSSTATRWADLQGAGTLIAATVIAQAGDVRRFRDAAAFARYCGAAPIPCGSGQTAGRHRLHRGGNRQLNAALYRIAIVQQRHHPAGPSLPGPQDRRRQDPPRSQPRTQTPPRQRHLPTPAHVGRHHPGHEPS